MTDRYVYVLALVLAATGLSIFAYQWRVIGFPLTAEAEKPVWTIEAAVSFDAGAGSVKAYLNVPTLTPGFRILNDNHVSRGYGYAVNERPGGNEAQWAIRRASGPQTIYYRISVYEDASARQVDTTPPFPTPPVIGEPYRTAVDVIVSEVRAQSADAASFTSELLHRLNDRSPDANVELMLGSVQSEVDFVEAATTVLATARIPARIVRGFPLTGRQRNTQPLAWLEIHDGDTWRYFNPRTGAETLPDRFLVWWRGNDALARVEGASNLEVDFAIQESYVGALAIAEAQMQLVDSPFPDISLYRLPIRTQAVYSVLLMIPIGALVMVFMRNIIGIDAFGTFMPVLIALAFRETQLLWGLILFTVLIALGLSIRFLLERLRLLLVPRLIAVLIVVVVLMLIISLISDSMEMDRGISVALFPMVIIAMTIERMSVVWEERGAVDALRAAMGSMIIAVFAYIAMGLPWLEHLIFTFPELLLVVLALVIVLGRYTGYRLFELGRFKALAGQ